MQLYKSNQVGEVPEVTALLRTQAESEHELETWLNANPDLLLEETILVFGRQYRLDTGVLDLVAVDRFGNTIVFEVKKGRSGSGSASEETILSQPQNYAQSLSKYSYTDLNDIYSEYQTGDWERSRSVQANETLADAFESVFGTSLDPEEYNDYQRMVIVAEEITRRTATNARWLLEEGLNVQCLEIQRFENTADGSTYFASHTVVDYDTKRVKPERQGAPTYPDVARQLVDLTFPALSELVEAETPHEVYEGLDGYEPGLRSAASYHPQKVKYVFHLRPLEWNRIRLDLQMRGGDERALEAIRKNRSLFEKRGFDVSSRKEIFVVTQDWETEDADLLSDEEFLELIAERFVSLVETGHEVFSKADLAKTDDADESETSH